jgi:hypothetical protein
MYLTDDYCNGNAAQWRALNETLVGGERSLEQ